MLVLVGSIGIVALGVLSVGLNLRLLFLIGKGVRLSRESIDDFDNRMCKCQSFNAQGGCKQLLKDMRSLDENKILLSNKDE